MASKPDKGYKGVGMEGPIARWYASSVRRDGTALADQVAQVRAYMPAGGDVLEVAPGPGFLAVALAGTGAYQVTGLDISETFVDIARGRAAEAGVDVDFRHGNVSAMPFDNESFDFVVCCAAFKNFSEPLAALQEMYRVLRPDGTALVLDLRRDVSKAAVAEDVTKMRLGPISRMSTKFILGNVLRRRAYTKAQFEHLLARSRFTRSEVRETRLSLEVIMRR